MQLKSAERRFFMSKLSCSFTLGKASNPHGANISHNHREFISNNVDVSRTAENICYIRQDVRAAYNELFGESLREYNEKQTRKDRIIGDYFQHISEGNREESYYEIIVQFGVMDTAKIGTETGETAKKMLVCVLYNRNVANINKKVQHLKGEYCPKTVKMVYLYLEIKNTRRTGTKNISREKREVMLAEEKKNYAKKLTERRCSRCARCAKRKWISAKFWRLEKTARKKNGAN